MRGISPRKGSWAERVQTRENLLIFAGFFMLLGVPPDDICSLKITSKWSKKGGGLKCGFLADSKHPLILDLMRRVSFTAHQKTDRDSSDRFIREGESDEAASVGQPAKRGDTEVTAGLSSHV